jgi:ATP-dependent exoDNAse (exonuclease V) beta subunit
MNSSNKNFKVYKSSAGSGKTFTLSKTFLKLALSGDSPDYFKNILAITFTVKAAAEMKERIVTYLSALAGNPTTRKDVESMRQAIMTESGLSQEEITFRSKNTLQALIHNYGEFSILTIDKFVHRMVRSFASDLGMAPDFEVEIDQSRLVDLVTTALLDKVGQEEGITKLILAFAETQTENDNSWNIEPSLAAFAKELSSEDFFLNATNLNHLDYNDALALIKKLNQEVAQFEVQIIAIGKRSLDILKENGVDFSDLVYGKGGVHSFFLKLLSSETLYDEDVLGKRAVKYLNGEKLHSKTASNPELVDSLLPQFNKLKEEYLRLSPSLKQAKFKKNLSIELFGLVLINELKQLFELIKVDENVKTLSDFNQILTEKLIEEQTPFIYEKLGNRYQHILIDEFQDTSALQWLNLKPLVENSLASGKENLIVGDAKQSIYRFRGSEPDQFIALPAVGGQSQFLFESSYDKQVLDTNYRSAHNIIRFNNRFFKELCRQILSDDQHSVYEDLHQNTFAKEDGEVRIHLIEKAYKDEKTEAYFEAMLKRIKALEAENKNALGETCMLFRSNKHASQFASLLLEQSIDVISEESLLIDNSAQAKLIIATLYAAKNFQDPFYLQSWLARLFQFSVVKGKHHSVAKKLKEDKLDFDGVCRLLKLPIKLSEIEQGDSFHRVFKLCKLYKMKLGNPFVAQLLDFSLNYEQSNLYLKQTFLDYYENQKSKLSVRLQDGGNAVRIMTIHKSKGLEFRHVFVYLPEVSNTKPTKTFGWLHNNEIVPELTDYLLPIAKFKGTPFEDIYEDELIKSKLDELNAIYVAFTRAGYSLDIFTNETDRTTAAPHNFIKTWAGFNETNNKLELIGPLPNDWD